MAATSYIIDLTDDDGQPMSGLTFGGLGASPGIASLAGIPGGQAIDPSAVPLTPLGYGYYAAAYDREANGDALLVLDCGAAYEGRTRYRGVALSGPDSAALAAALADLAALLGRTDPTAALSALQAAAAAIRARTDALPAQPAARGDVQITVAVQTP